LPRLFGGQEFFCPLRNHQTFVFMINTKILHLMWIMENPHSHQRCLSLQEGSIYLGKGQDQCPVKAGELILVIYFATYNFCSQITANSISDALFTGQSSFISTKRNPAASCPGKTGSSRAPYCSSRDKSWQELSLAALPTGHSPSHKNLSTTSQGKGSLALAGAHRKRCGSKFSSSLHARGLD